MREFVQLHVHTKYSEKDALPDPKDYAKEIAKRARTDNEKALAVSEHGHMVSFIKHYLACKEQGVKAIIGSEFYVIESNEVFQECLKKISADKKAKKALKAENKDSQFEDDEDDKPLEYYKHLVILAKNETGLKNLFKLATLAGMNGYKPHNKTFNLLEEKHLKGNCEGLICLTACVGGLIPQLILKDRLEEAEAKILEYKSYFDELYLEVQPHDIEKQIQVNDTLVKLSNKLNIPLVITTDAHFISPEDRKYHDILKIVDNPKARLFPTLNDLKTADEIENYCIKYGIPLSAMDNTINIANECNVDPMPKDTKGLMPSFTCPNGYTEEDYLRELMLDGLKEKIIEKSIEKPGRYIKQALYELEVICSMGFAGYFLILWDWLKWCRKEGIPTGKGRGSSGGSIVSYCLNITSVDPVKYNCYFERFLNVSRIELPDIDSDVSQDKRQKAIEYLMNKYGIDNVSQIITFTQFGLKNTIKEIMRAYGHNYEEANNATKALDDRVKTLDKIEGMVERPEDYPDAEDEDFEIAEENYKILQELFDKYPEVRDGLAKLRGCIASMGLHPSGIVISSKPLMDFLPFLKGSETAILPVCQVDMKDIHDLKALKIDALGLRNLTQIKECMDLVGLTFEWYDSEDYSDDKVYEMLRRKETADIFQMAKRGATNMLSDFGVKNIEGVIAVNAANRPGCLAEVLDDPDKPGNKISMAQLYARNKKIFEETGKIPSLHPRIDYIVANTYGCILYQEQVMAISREVAGYSLGMADIRIRKTFTNKKQELVPEIENEFIYGKKTLYDDKGNVIGKSEENSSNCIGAVNNGLTEEEAIKLWDMIKKFAKYGFNLAHKMIVA